jgi:hypothetical protein
MSEGATEARMEVRDPVGGARKATVALRPVHLGRLVALIESRSRERERDTYARRLALEAPAGAGG